jgi:hypothetical protein
MSSNPQTTSSDVAETIAKIKSRVAVLSRQPGSARLRGDKYLKRVLLTRMSLEKRAGELLLAGGAAAAKVGEKQAARWRKLARMDNAEFLAEVQAFIDRGGGARGSVCPRVEMMRTEFVRDENGILTREIYAK